MRWRRALALALLTPFAYGLLAVASLDPVRTDALYSQGLFPLVRAALAACSRPFPMSVAELLLVATVAVVGLRVARGLAGLARGTRGAANLAAHAAAQTLAAAGVAALVFQLAWGLNHARLPFAAHAGLTVRAFGTAELAGAVRHLAAEASEERALLGAGDFRLRSGVVEPRLAAAWDAVAERYPVLAGDPPRVRLALLSPLLSRCGLTGIYCPFTAEAHVNGELPPTSLFFTACHEIAHERGFAREDEANFLGYLVCRASDDAAVRYSGSLNAFVHALNELARVDPPRARAAIAALPEPVRCDLGLVRSFWDERRSMMTAVAEHTNHTFLKAQGRPEGRASYGRMAHLLVAYLAVAEE